MTEMGAKPNVWLCVRCQIGVTESGRKRNDRFGEGRPEKQTASYRPNPAIRDIFARPLKQTAAGPT
jgi:hypothetical protein